MKPNPGAIYYETSIAGSGQGLDHLLPRSALRMGIHFWVVTTVFLLALSMNEAFTADSDWEWDPPQRRDHVPDVQGTETTVPSTVDTRYFSLSPFASNPFDMSGESVATLTREVQSAEEKVLTAFRSVQRNSDFDVHQARALSDSVELLAHTATKLLMQTVNDIRSEAPRLRTKADNAFQLDDRGEELVFRRTEKTLSVIKHAQIRLEKHIVDGQDVARTIYLGTRKVRLGQLTLLAPEDIRFLIGPDAIRSYGDLGLLPSGMSQDKLTLHNRAQDGCRLIALRATSDHQSLPTPCAPHQPKRVTGWSSWQEACEGTSIVVSNVVKRRFGELQRYWNENRHVSMWVRRMNLVSGYFALLRSAYHPDERFITSAWGCPVEGRSSWPWQ